MHAVPGHIHFVVQPVTAARMEEYDGLHGLRLQLAMFERRDAMPADEVNAIAARVRAHLAAG